MGLEALKTIPLSGNIKINSRPSTTITATYGVESKNSVQDRVLWLLRSYQHSLSILAPISALFNQEFSRALCVCVCYHHPTCIPIFVCSWIYLAPCLSEVTGPLKLYHSSPPRSINRSCISITLFFDTFQLGSGSITTLASGGSIESLHFIVEVRKIYLSRWFLESRSTKMLVNYFFGVDGQLITGENLPTLIYQFHRRD